MRNIRYENLDLSREHVNFDTENLRSPKFRKNKEGDDLDRRLPHNERA